MTSDRLETSVALARRVRFSGDHDHVSTVSAPLEASHVRYQYDEHGLRVSPDVTPGLFAVVKTASERLQIDPSAVTAFVYASPEIQATCFVGDAEDCLITITSSLVELLSEQELAFVLGHEIGHFLFGHGARSSDDANSVEGLMRRRAAEISADRIGMIASGDKDVVFRALIKTHCGLDGSHLRFDIGAYLEQLRRAAASPHGPSAESTHPSMVFRCRALLWFEMSREYQALIGQDRGESLAAIDTRLVRDLKRFIDGPAQQRIADARKTFRIWLATLAVVRDGRLDNAEQVTLKTELGPDISRKVIAFLSEYETRAEIEVTVRQKLDEAAAHYRSIAPDDFNTEGAAIADGIGTLFEQQDFKEYVMEFVSRPTE